MIGMRYAIDRKSYLGSLIKKVTFDEGSTRAYLNTLIDPLCLHTGAWDSCIMRWGKEGDVLTFSLFS